MTRAFRSQRPLITVKIAQTLDGLYSFNSAFLAQPQ